MKTILVLFSLYFSSNLMAAGSEYFPWSINVGESSTDILGNILRIATDNLRYSENAQNSSHQNASAFVYVSSDSDSDTDADGDSPSNSPSNSPDSSDSESSSSSSSSSSLIPDSISEDARYEQLSQEYTVLDGGIEYEAITIRPETAREAHAEVYLNHLLYMRPNDRNLEIRILSNDLNLPDIIRTFRNLENFQDFINQNKVRMNRLRNRLEYIRITILHLETESESEIPFPVILRNLRESIRDFMGVYGNVTGQGLVVRNHRFGKCIEFTYRANFEPSPLNLK